MLNVVPINKQSADVTWYTLSTDVIADFVNVSSFKQQYGKSVAQMNSLNDHYCELIEKQMPSNKQIRKVLDMSYFSFE